MLKKLAFVACCWTPIFPISPMVSCLGAAIPSEDSPGDLNSKDEKAVHAALMGLMKNPQAAAKALPRLNELVKWEWTENSKLPIDETAATVLGTLGKEAKSSLPVLLEQMKSPKRSSGYRVAAANAIARIDGPPPDVTRDLVLEFNHGCRSLSLFATELPKSHPAEITRHLITLLSDADPKVRESSCYLFADNSSAVGFGPFKAKDMLEKAGPVSKEVPDALSLALKDPVVKVKIAAAHGLLAVAPGRADEIIPSVLAGIHSAEFRSKKGGGNGVAAADLLNRVGDKDKVYQALLPLLEDANPGTRNETIDVLAHLPIKDRLQALIKSGTTKNQRAGAVSALAKTYNFQEHIADLLGALKDPEIEVRFAAAIGYVSNRWRGPIPAEVIIALIEGLESPNKALQLTGLRWVRIIESAGKPATATLQKLLKHPELEIRKDAALALITVNNPEADEAVLPLTQALEANIGWNNVDILDCLSKLGPRAKSALPTIEKIYTSPPSIYAAHAAMAAAMIDPEKSGPTAALILAKMLKNKGQSRVSSDRIAELFMKIGPTGKPAVQTLIQELNDPQNASGILALTIIRIDPASAKPALDWIHEHLSKGDKDENAFDIAREMPKLGPAAIHLQPELLNLLKSPVSFFRSQAALTLGNIGPDAKAALPTLKQLAQSDPEDTVKTRAKQAITKIEGKK